MESGAGTVEADRQLEPFDADAEQVGAGPGRLHVDALECLALKRGEGTGDVACALGKLLAARQLAVSLQRGLLSLGTVDATNAACRKPELDDLLERLRLVFPELAVLDRSDQIGEPAAPLCVLHQRHHGLR